MRARTRTVATCTDCNSHKHEQQHTDAVTSQSYTVMMATGLIGQLFFLPGHQSNTLLCYVLIILCHRAQAVSPLSVNISSPIVIKFFLNHTIYSFHIFYYRGTIILLLFSMITTV